MKTTILERLLQEVSLLSPRQRERVIEALSQGSAPGGEHLRLDRRLRLARWPVDGIP